MVTITLSSLLINLHRSAKLIIVILIDSSLCVLSLWLALYLRLGEFVNLDWKYVSALATSLILAIPIFILSGLYRAIFRYSGWSALMNIAKGVLIYGVIYASMFTVHGIVSIPRTIGIIQPVLLLILVAATRSIAHYWLGGAYKQRIGASAKERVLIYGAGSAGRQLADALSGNSEIKILGFLDDDRHLIGRVLKGLTIYSPEKILENASRLKVTHIYLAIPSVSRRRRQEIIEQVRRTQVSIRTLPSFSDIAQGKITINDLRELDIDELLGRPIVEPDYALLTQNIMNKAVMVTGAGGSIGSELCRQIIHLDPTRILLVEHSEFALYQITKELMDIKARFNLDAVQINPILASVRDLDAIERIFLEYPLDTIYHAAAYKHVPLVEENVIEGTLNNVFGTKILTELVIKYSVLNFVLISTDKAVRPTNIMGATKRWAELIVQSCAAQALKSGSKQRFCAVRFGNVLGSSGSVVPLFRSQISKGGPITLTHPEITRYFMSIEEAVALVLQAGSISDGGEIYLLDMGIPIKIFELAQSMIKLSGHTIKDDENPDGDIEIAITGLRPGEKLHEELLINLNSSAPTPHPKIYKALEPMLAERQVKIKLSSLEEHIKSRDELKVRKTLMDVATDIKLEMASP